MVSFAALEFAAAPQSDVTKWQLEVQRRLIDVDPAKFPILILVPALALDLLWHRLKNWKPWQIALVSGIVFIAVLTAVEWNFGNFLLSDASKNRFFGTIYFDYNSRPTGPDRLRQWLSPDQGVALYTGLLRATVYASISTWIGLRFGRWMRGVQR